MSFIVLCTGIRSETGKTPHHGPFTTRREADEFANFGHFCFAWHTITEVDRAEAQPAPICPGPNLGAGSRCAYDQQTGICVTCGGPQL